MPIATIDGIALKPGRSRNNRLYTSETIGRAVQRAQARITAAQRPVSMRTHHAAGDDSTRLTGHLTSLTQESDGSAPFTAVITGTPAGATVATLADDRDGPPTLRGVSIRGNWIGPVRTVIVDGVACETADDLEIVGVDWTAEPGVDGAQVTSITFLDDDTAAQETAGERHPITESAEETSVTITEEATPTTTATSNPVAGSVTITPAPAAGGLWADHGYLGERQYPLNTLTEARGAWFALGETSIAGRYQKPQLKRMRGRVKAALERHGVTVTTEGWLAQPARQVVESVAGGAVTEGGWVDSDASFRVCLSNGQVDVTVSSWYVDPADLDSIARAAMDGACKCLAALDPDADGDVDAPVAVVSAETAVPAAGQVAEAADAASVAAPETPDVDPATGTANDTEEAAVGEPNTDSAAAGTTAAPSSVTLSGEQFAALLAAVGNSNTAPAAVPAVAPVESAPVAPVVQPAPVAPVAAESAPAAAAPVTETQEQLVVRLVQEGMAAQRAGLIQELAQSMPLGRRGIVVSETSAPTGVGAPAALPAGLPQKELHTYTPDERQLFDRYIAGTVIGDPYMVASVATTA